MRHTRQPAETWSASLLRRDLNARAQHLASSQRLLHEHTTGGSPSVIFGCDEQGRHGNFHPASYAAILANPAWSRRLAKVHTAHARSRARADWQWMELDCANSSDALLMNIFCHPGVFHGGHLEAAVATLLNVSTTAKPEFGIHPGVPLHQTRRTRSRKLRANPTPVLFPQDRPPDHLTDRTEIDLQLSDLFLEAKLTESNFQTAPLRLIERYRDLETVFDTGRLPFQVLYFPATHPSAEDFSQIALHPGEDTGVEAAVSAPEPRRGPSRTVVQGYQLIRNVLAAYAADASFSVLCDGRRRDLIETWYTILSAVHYPSFAWRLKLLTWQELAAVLPRDLQTFLVAKYGIVPT